MKWYEDLIEKAKGFIRDGDALLPVLFMRSKNRIDIVPLGKFSDNKEVLAKILHMIVQLEDPDNYLYMTEAFVKMVDPKDAGDAAIGSLLVEGTIQVSQLPSAREAITVLLGDRRGEKLGMVIFTRDNLAVTFEPIKWLEGDELTGRFTRLRDAGKASPPRPHKKPEQGRHGRG